MKNTLLNAAIVSVLGFTAVTTSSMASAGVMTATWTGYHYFLDPTGNALANTSTAKGVNQQATLISGTMQYDDVTGAGTATMAPFDWGSNQLGKPMQFSGINLQAIGDGMGGAGSLMLANMQFDWNGTYGMPVSVVLDAAGFLAGEYSAGGANSATPATDGTYIGQGTPGGYADANGYLAQGAMPIVTTAWNTSLAAGCVQGVDGNYSNNTGGGCMGVSPSGVLPLVVDTIQNQSDYLANTGASPGTWDAYGSVYGVGGNPMADGPFQTYNHNFNIGAISVTGYNANAGIEPNCSWDTQGYCFGLVVPAAVPVPAAAWLFGSGLISLIGAARRRKA